MVGRLPACGLAIVERPLYFTHPDAQATWMIDLAVHSVRYISVESHVQLKVVDWGGSGRPLRRSLDRLSSDLAHGKRKS